MKDYGKDGYEYWKPTPVEDEWYAILIANGKRREAVACHGREATLAYCKRMNAALNDRRQGKKVENPA